MRNFFSKLSYSSQSPSGIRRTSSGETETELAQLLSSTEEVLRHLRVITGQDFPKLNEATKLVQQLEGAVMRMTNQDMKMIWKSQVEELQRELQLATSRMLSLDYDPKALAAAAGPQYTPAQQTASPLVSPRRLPTRPAAPSLSTTHRGGPPPPPPSSSSPLQPAARPATHSTAAAAVPSLFDGLQFNGPSSPSAGPPQSDPSPGGDLFSGLDISADDSGTGLSFAGLDVNGTGAPDGPTTASKATNAVADAAVDEPPGFGVSGRAPLDEDLFCDLAALSSSTSMDHPDSSLAAPLSSAPSSSAPTPAPAPALVELSSLLDDPATLPPVSHIDPLPHSTAAVPTSGLTSSHEYQSGAANLGPGGKRKKKITKRVGYARGKADDDGDAMMGSIPDSYPVTTTVEQDQPLPRVPSTAASILSDVSADLSEGGLYGQHTTGTSMASVSGRPDSAVSSGSVCSSAAAAIQQDAGHARSSSSLGKQVSMASSSGSTGNLALLGDIGPLGTAGLYETSSQGLGIGKKGGTTLGAVLDSDPAASFAAELAAIQRGAEASVKALHMQLEAALRLERTAKQRRSELSMRAQHTTKKIRGVEEAQSVAVDKEDFDSAASLGAELDSLQVDLTACEREIKMTERQCESAISQRVDIVAKQVTVWEDAAAATQSLRSKQQQAATAAQEGATKGCCDLSDRESDAMEHLTELRSRIKIKSAAVEEQSAALDKKVNDAAKGVLQQREQAKEAHALIEQEVERLRAMLAAKEDELQSSAAQLEELNAKVAAVESKYSKSRAVLEDDRRALESDIARCQAEEKALERLQEQKVEVKAAVEATVKLLDKQVEDASLAISDMLQQANKIKSQLETEEKLRSLMLQLRNAEQEADENLAALEADAENKRSELRDLVSQRVIEKQKLRDAEEVALAAKRKVPELERDKKAAAAAKDFKEAARLSAEAKAAISAAESAEQETVQLKSLIASLEGQEGSTSRGMAEAEGKLAEAKRKLARARWRRLKMTIDDLQRQIDNATDNEDYTEAENLQQELDGLTAEAQALVNDYGFTEESDLSDIEPPSISPLPQELPVPASSADAAPEKSTLARGTSNGSQCASGSVLQAAESIGHHSKYALPLLVEGEGDDKKAASLPSSPPTAAPQYEDVFFGMEVHAGVHTREQSGGLSGESVGGDDAVELQPPEQLSCEPIQLPDFDALAAEASAKMVERAFEVAKVEHEQGGENGAGLIGGESAKGNGRAVSPEASGKAVVSQSGDESPLGFGLASVPGLDKGTDVLFQGADEEEDEGGDLFAGLQVG